MSPLFENGVIFLKSGMRELEQELTTFPYSKHDDLMDALSWQIGSRTSTEYEQKPEDKPPLPSGKMVFTLDQIRESCRQKKTSPYPFQRQTDYVFAGQD